MKAQQRDNNGSPSQGNRIVYSPIDLNSQLRNGFAKDIYQMPGQRWSSLQQLTLMRWKHDIQGDFICKVLSTINCPLLQRLQLENFNISKSGCIHLSKALFPKVTKFSLSGNQSIQDESVSIISRITFPLINVNLNEIKISIKGLYSLLLSQQSIKSIWLIDNLFSNHQMDVVRSALRSRWKRVSFLLMYDYSEPSSESD